MEIIRELSYQDVCALRIHDKSLIFSPKAKYMALSVDNTIVSVTALQSNARGLKLQANYTFEQYRGLGYFDKLLKYVIMNYNCDLYADCLPTSVGIYTRNSFKVYKIVEFKNFTIYYTKLERR